MKHILLILVLLLFASCNCENNVQTEPTNIGGFEIIRINNHQYLWHKSLYRECLCHYEDCDYCKKHRNY